MPVLRVRRDDLSSSELAEGEAPRSDLAEGEAQLLIERFALTANNITYGVFGDQLGYWQLFPAPGGWGHIPAWGYARVVTSRVPALDEGRRVFGLVPMGSYVTVRPALHSIGFADTSPHRSELSPVYNQYLSVEGEGDDAALLMRPLFGTSLLLDLVLSEAGFDNARTVVLTSASSKTAYGLAHLLRERPVETVGLTSASRREWVEGLGLYDTVLAYEDLGEVRAPGGAVFVDFAGDRGLVRGVHEQLGDALQRSVLVGFTHHEAAADEASLPGPVPEFFFAPTEMAKRGRELADQYAGAWRDFAPVVQRTMRIERVADGDQLLRVYRDLLEGRVDPGVGCIATL
jgi:hypothetical protein